MGSQTVQKRRTIWALARQQHGVVSRRQLLSIAVHPKAIHHRIAKARLHPVWRGIYAVGRRQLTQRGRWMAAILACGPGAVLSHRSAASLWGIRRRTFALTDSELEREFLRLIRRAGLRIR